MRKKMERRGRREPQKTQRKNVFLRNHALTFCEKDGYYTQAGTGSRPLQPLSFLCDLREISVSSVFRLSSANGERP
jgi:hypothetical protein